MAVSVLVASLWLRESFPIRRGMPLSHSERSGKCRRTAANLQGPQERGMPVVEIGIPPKMKLFPETSLSIFCGKWGRKVLSAAPLHQRSCRPLFVRLLIGAVRSYPKSNSGDDDDGNEF